MSHRETLRAVATGWSHGADAIRGVLEELERAEADARDARNYVVEVAIGVSHYPHAEGEPCVRCAKEQLEERVRVCLRVNEELGKELLAAERGGKRGRTA